MKGISVTFHRQINVYRSFPPLARFEGRVAGLRHPFA